MIKFKIWCNWLEIHILCSQVSADINPLYMNSCQDIQINMTPSTSHLKNFITIQLFIQYFTTYFNKYISVLLPVYSL